MEKSLLNRGQQCKMLDRICSHCLEGLEILFSKSCQRLSILRPGGCRAAVVHGIPVRSKMLANLLARR